MIKHFFECPGVGGLESSYAKKGHFSGNESTEEILTGYPEIMTTAVNGGLSQVHEKQSNVNV